MIVSMKQIAFSFALILLLLCSCGSNTTKSEITAEMAYEAVSEDGQRVGGAIITANGTMGELAFLYVKVGVQSKGIGQSIWKAIEAMHPEIEVWETCTPYFDRRNIHFYINRCGFHAVEFFNERHPDPNMPEQLTEQREPSNSFEWPSRDGSRQSQFDQEDGLFKFEKRMK